MTKELTDTLRKNKTIDWQKREKARSTKRMIIKRLLKKYGYPPEGEDDAIKTVMLQCELWTDNYDFKDENDIYVYSEKEFQYIAEENSNYSN